LFLLGFFNCHGLTKTKWKALLFRSHKSISPEALVVLGRDHSFGAGETNPRLLSVQKIIYALFQEGELF